MRWESDWRARNNTLHVDLFERSSQLLSSSASSSTLDMAGMMREILGDVLVTMLGLSSKDPLLVFMHQLVEIQILG